MMTQQAFYEAKLAYEVDSADVKAALDQGLNWVLVDTRAEQAYQTETIPGALSFPHRTMTAESTASLDKSVVYIAFCDGIGCNGSTKGALKLAALGFDVRELMGGLDWWKRDGYATSVSAATATSIGCHC